MIGDRGPYMNDEGDIWVPRTVPWREARAVASEAHPGDPWLSLHYIGKSEAELLGFVRDCLCEERCCGGPPTEYGDCTTSAECRVPAWHFRLDER